MMFFRMMLASAASTLQAAVTRGECAPAQHIHHVGGVWPWREFNPPGCFPIDPSVLPISSGPRPSTSGSPPLASKLWMALYPQWSPMYQMPSLADSW